MMKLIGAYRRELWEGAFTNVSLPCGMPLSLSPSSRGAKTYFLYHLISLATLVPQTAICTRLLPFTENKRFS
jgi:hypothetical protein